MWGQPPSAVRRAKLDGFFVRTGKTEPLPPVRCTNSPVCIRIEFLPNVRDFIREGTNCISGPTRSPKLYTRWPIPAGKSWRVVPTFSLASGIGRLQGPWSTSQACKNSKA